MLDGADDMARTRRLAFYEIGHPYARTRGAAGLARRQARTGVGATCAADEQESRLSGAVWRGGAGQQRVGGALMSRVSLALDPRLQLVFVVKDPATDPNPRGALIFVSPTFKRAWGNPEDLSDASRADQSASVNDDFVSSGLCLRAGQQRQHDRGWLLVSGQATFFGREHRSLNTIRVVPPIAHRWGTWRWRVDAYGVLSTRA
jgi:hypothetical protein